MLCISLLLIMIVAY